MPRRKHAAQASAQNIRIVNQKHIERNQGVIEVSPSREHTPFASDLQTESILEPELTDFCSRLHITPAIIEFHDDDDSDIVSNHSSDIEEETELRKFTQALQNGQNAALKREKEENKKKRGVYSKQSSNTLKRRKLDLINMTSKGFYPLEEYVTRMGVPVKYNKPIPKVDKISLQEECHRRYGRDD
ncbi:hypothetical protein F5888DRAFT_1802076 [Russula emetica]|nr:hypothetical protein F5888DRAFT_1802076 [Russula emetica]